MGPTLETVVEAEAYWEVHAADALSAVYSIADRLETAAGMHTIRQYLPEVRTMASEGDLNSKAVAIDLTRDVAVAVYAKAHDVVRFEVRYRRNVRATVARNLTGRVGADVIMDRMREDAARRMSRITETLNAMMEAPHFDRQALCDMMAAIHWAGVAMTRQQGGFFHR